MSKKRNTILFMLAGTVVNVLLMILFFLIFLVLYARYLVPNLPESTASWFMLFIFVASIVLSFLVYRRIVNLIAKKIDMDKYFDPIFGKRRPPPRKPQD